MKKLLGALLVGGAVAGLVALYRDKLPPLATMAREKLDTIWGLRGGEEDEPMEAVRDAFERGTKGYTGRNDE